LNRELPIIREKNWSLNLEDSYYEEHIDEIVPESVKAVVQTKPGCYVNIVTPEEYGDPRDSLIPQLSSQLMKKEIPVKEIRYIDQCGCGGYVTRVYR